MKELPNVPSELLRTALADLTACEKDDRYKINMGVWHDKQYPTIGGELDEGKYCHVCLAGSMLAKTLNWSPGTGADFETLPPALQRKLSAVDAFRRGHVGSGLRYMGVQTKTYFADHIRPVPPYVRDPQGFKSALSTLACDLALVGL